MGWVYLLNRRLDEMNSRRAAEGRTPLTWAEVELLTGVKESLLRNLAYNSILRTTNTRFLDSLCRFFGCEISQLIQPAPRQAPGPPQQDQIDGLLEAIRSGQLVSADFHIDRLYGDAAEEWWRDNLQEIRPPLRQDPNQ